MEINWDYLAGRLSVVNDSEVSPSSYNVITEDLPQTNSHTCHELHPSCVQVPAKKMFDLDVDCIEDKDGYEMSEAGTATCCFI